jgi:hypothetical protein
MRIAAKSATKVRAGKLGARARWGEPRVVRLDSLTSEQRRLVLALVDAAKKEAVAEVQTPATADAEVRRGSVDPAA